MRRSIRSVRNATSSSPSPSRHSLAPYASPTAMRTIEIGACTPPSGATPGMRRPVRTMTLPPISSRRMRFGEPTSPRPSGVIVAAFNPRPCSRIAVAASCTTPLSVSRRRSSERSNRGKSSSTPMTSGSRTRRLSSSSSCPVSSPSRTTMVRSSRIARPMVSTFAASALGRQPDDMGWSRKGRKGAFRYYDSSGKCITDESKLDRIEALAIPPAWKEVSISPRSTAKLQATGFDAAGRKQYLYSADYRAQQERAKYDKLIRFGDALPTLREAMSLHFDEEEFARERVSAIALRLIELGWLRVGSERYVRDGTYGVTTLLRRHVEVRGKRVCLSFPAKHGIRVRTQVVDPDLAAAMRRMLEIKGPRVFKYEWEGRIYNLTNKQLNEYVKIYLGEEFSAKDFRTWGGTLLAAIYLAERAAKEGFPDSEQEQKRSVTAVMRRVAERLRNTPAVTRESDVSPAVVEQYLDGRTIDDFRPPHLRLVKARDVGLTPADQAMLSLLRSWRIRRARAAA